MNKKALAIANTLALLVTVFLNYLSNTGIFNGNTMSSISARYDNLFTPAGYAFSIWGLIYIGLFGFIFYQWRIFAKKDSGEEEQVVSDISWWFVLSCIANCLWIVAWLYDYTGLSVIVMIVLLISLLSIIVNNAMEITSASVRKKMLVWLPFSLYTGWISVAIIANIAAYLTKIGWGGFGIPELSWTLIMIGIAGFIHLYMTWKRNMREFALVAAWALVAIAVANQQTEQVVVAAFTVAAILVLSSIIHAIKHWNVNR